MILFNQRLDLFVDSGAIKAHHEELAHLSVTTVMIEKLWWLLIEDKPVEIIPYWEKPVPCSHGFRDGPARAPFPG